MMHKGVLLKEAIKNGYAKEEDGSRVWDISRRSFRYINQEMAEAFLKLREHPRYKATVRDTELSLLKEHAETLLAKYKDDEFNLIELGCTDGSKTNALLSQLSNHKKIRYCPVTVNQHFLKLAEKNVMEEHHTNITAVAPTLSKTYSNFSETSAILRNTTYQKNVVLLLGSLISSFDINDYLYNLSQSMLPGDTLIIGNGIRTGDDRLANIGAYKHPLFDNWLKHLMTYLGFEQDETTYGARFENERLEAYYSINKDKTVEHEGQKVEFKQGDKIIVGVQYKWYEKELKDFCEMYFEKTELIKDEKNEYAIIKCEK